MNIFNGLQQFIIYIQSNLNRFYFERIDVFNETVLSQILSETTLISRYQHLFHDFSPVILDPMNFNTYRRFSLSIVLNNNTFTFELFIRERECQVRYNEINFNPFDICYDYVPNIIVTEHPTVNRIEYNPTPLNFSNQKSTNLVKKGIGWK